MSARDDARAVLARPDAPAAEKYDAQQELQRMVSVMPSDMIPPQAVREAVAFINDSLADQSVMRKSINSTMPGRVTPPPKRGMQSIYLDQMQIQVNGDYYEKGSSLGFDQLREMVTQTPILNAVVMTRIRQVSRFCGMSEDGGIGFEIRHVDKKHQLTGVEEESCKLLGKFFSNCGWEWNPRKRKGMRRDNFVTFMAKLVRDSLTMDAAPIETEMRRDKDMGIDGLYAVDGATIRLCTEEGYEDDDEIYALQVVQGNVATAYTRDQLIYEVRNPRSDVTMAGYGLGETELLIRTVTGFLNAMTLNTSYFDSNALPKGVLQIVGDYAQEDITGFKRIWNSWVKGVNNAWSLPVLVAKDSDSKAEFTPINSEVNEMLFARWMTFLTSIICAIYGMSPDEINFDSFSAGTSSLSGSDTEEKLAESKDKGLRPLLSYFENTLSDYVVSSFGDKYCFRWVGLDDEDADKAWEAAKLVSTVDEIRAQQGMKAHPNPDLGALPVNPTLIQPAMQLMHPQAQPQQPQGSDFGGQGDSQDFGDEDKGGGGQGGGQGPGDPNGASGDDTPDPDSPGGGMEGEFGGSPADDSGSFGKAISASAIYGLR